MRTLLFLLALCLSAVGGYADTFTLNVKSSREVAYCTNIMAGDEDDSILVVVTPPTSLSLFTPYLILNKIGTLTGSSYLVVTWKAHVAADTGATIPVYGSSTSDSGSVGVRLMGGGGSAYHRLSFRDSTGVSRDSLLLVDTQRWPQEYYPFTLSTEVSSVGGDFAPPLSGSWEFVIRLNGVVGNQVRVTLALKNEKR